MPSQSTQSAKQTLRARLTHTRRALRDRPQEKAALDASLLSHAVAFLHAVGAQSTNIAAYNPLPSEPGAVDFAGQLRAHARRVFVPLSLPNGVLGWAECDPARAQRGALGITEPSGPRFTSRVLDSCGVLLVPALGVDTRGMRIGKGAGYYDRALAHTKVPAAAVVYDDNVVERVPHDAHDTPVQAVITPSGWWWAAKR